MPILNLNTNTPRSQNARKNAAPIRGVIFNQGLATIQHPITAVDGRTYNSPFTESSKNLFTGRTNTATQPQLPALKRESPGDVVPLHEFVKVHPNEKGKTFSTQPHRAIVSRVGGPSQFADTPANPNAPKLKAVARPHRYPVAGKNETLVNLSFLRSGGTLSAHSNHDKFQSRWSVTKKGAAG